METRRSGALPAELIAELASRGEVKRYARNEQILAEGEASDALYVLISGQLKVFTQDHRNRELVYNVLDPGEMFGEMFLDGGVRSASVRAISPAQCVVIDKALIRSFVATYPLFAECLISKLIERVRHATHQIKQLGFNDVFGRTIALIEQESVVEEGVRVLPRRFTQQEIADRVGASREMINRVLRDLVQGGFLVKDEQRRLLIPRPLPDHL